MLAGAGSAMAVDTGRLLISSDLSSPPNIKWIGTEFTQFALNKLGNYQTVELGFSWQLVQANTAD